MTTRKVKMTAIAEHVSVIFIDTNFAIRDVVPYPSFCILSR
jgi:hypothetical protein